MKGSSNRYLGVYKSPNGKWAAYLCNKSLGRFASEEEAARAYDAAMMKLPPERWRHLNFPKVPVAPAGASLIQLTQNKWAIVDEEDYEKLNQYTWYAIPSRDKFYVARRENNKIQVMHRQILCPPEGMHCDHINGDRLDNRKSNLRLATLAQNNCNKKKQNKRVGTWTSSYKGVLYFKRDSNWRCEINANNIHLHVGYFKEERQAALAYNYVISILHGEFARLNEVEGILDQETIDKLNQRIQQFYLRIKS